MKSKAELILCAKSLSVLTQKHIKTQVRLNQTLLASKTALLAKGIPLIEIARKAVIVAAKSAQEINHKVYLKDISKMAHCNYKNKIQYINKYPFENQGILLKRKFDLIQLKRKSWNVTLISKDLKNFLILHGDWQVRGNLNTFSQFTFRKRAAPLSLL
jgi:hypothetical protein